MENIALRKATIADLTSLQKISRETFFETFAAHNTADNMAKYLDQEFTERKLSLELNNQNSAFYFAENEGQVIGYLKINFGNAQTELKEDNALEIERIYVSKQFHGKSVGQILYDKAMEIAHNKNADYVWLGVWEENHRAINFYKKNGFTQFNKHLFMLGDDEQTDIMMKLKLIRNS
jgi:ribosomal protein S18 acetylase RimI-like enzyme